jgi:hypothetical protein
MSAPTAEITADSPAEIAAAIPTPLAGAPPSPDEGPYRIVLTRLQRLVQYRAQLRQALASDPGNQRAGAELIRVGHMVREVHRAVSLNAGARLVAQRIDPEAPPPVTPAPPRLPRF